MAMRSKADMARRSSRAILIAVAITIVGCSEQPARVDAPAWEPERMADQAMASFDQDGDGQLSEAELASVPSLKYCRKSLDADGNQDGQISRSEIRDRLKRYRTMATGLTSFRCKVFADNKPLANAKVRLVPEPFLAEVLKPVEGASDPDGLVHFLSHAGPLSVVPPGMYRVEITAETKRIPPEYNAQTTLGVEISAMSDPFHSAVPEFHVETE